MSITLGSTLSTYAVLASSTITNTGSSVITGFIGLSPGSSITGFPPGTGTINNTNAEQAQTELTSAYTTAQALQYTSQLSASSYITVNNQVFTPGVYSIGSSLQINDTLILNGSGQYIFQIGSTLTTASSSVIQLMNGADPCDIFWQVGSSATLGTSTTFCGSILANISITCTTSANVDGRLLARYGAVTLDTNNINNTCICYVKGTKILTNNGYKNIEDIKVGDMVSIFGNIKNRNVINKSNGHLLKKVLFVGYFTKSILGKVSKPIVFKANSLGNNKPFEDVAVSPGHGIMVNNKLVLASNLVNNNSIYQSEDYDSVTYYHLELENHCIINACGLLGESLLGFKDNFTSI